MDTRRTRIFGTASLILLLVVLARLAYLQLGDRRSIQQRINRLKEQQGRSFALGTIRGRILDRKGRILAQDQAAFSLQVGYELTQYADPNVLLAKRLAAMARANPERALQQLEQEVAVGKLTLGQVIEKCARFGDPCELLWQRVYRFNQQLWHQRLFQVWRRHCQDSELYKGYADRIVSVPLAQALQDLEDRIPDPNRRILLAGKVDIAQMRGGIAIVELRTDDDVVAAELEFAGIKPVRIEPRPVRVYPYRSAACQIIGWVGPATQPEDVNLFADDPMRQYLDGEVCGREDGVEYMCEALLRGRRGREVYDVDGTLARQVPNRLGTDVQLTIDIDLQVATETLMRDIPLPGNCGPGMAAVVLDVKTCQILAMASMPTYDLNEARTRYLQLSLDPNQPLLNRAMNKHYPAGSVVKPIVLAAAMTLNIIDPDKVINCPSQPAPEGWPNCWIFRQEGRGHDSLWPNNARNALRGSCNIYFSRLAAMLDPTSLQQWLWAFGLGHQLDLGYPECQDPQDRLVTQRNPRRLRQAPGQISGRPVYGRWITDMNQIGPLSENDLRLVGIGQGNCWVTPIQVAVEMATIARGGIFRQPRLFMTQAEASTERDLGLSDQCMKTLLDGLAAVVNEEHGTAYEAFKDRGLQSMGIQVYGKTGSTQRPANAWFAGFAKDRTGKAIAVAVLVEGGTSGATDAAPLARRIIERCVQLGYLGS